MSNLNALTQQFGIKNEVSFREGAGGLIFVDVKNKSASASIVMQGAHLVDWTPNGHKPVIWLSPDAKFAVGKSIRGGVPVCWPWFGPHESKKEFPAHGYARTVMWDLISVLPSVDGSSTTLGFRLKDDDKTRAMWPHECSLEMVYHVGKTLDIDLVTHNRSGAAFTIGQALHTYFAVGDLRQVKISGLDACPYLDKVDGFKRKTQSGDISIGEEVDRIYLNSTADCVINDASLKRKIRIAKLGSASTVVWSPWEEKAKQMGDLGADGHLRMVCVESANAAEDVVNVPANSTCRLQVRYSVENL